MRSGQNEQRQRPVPRGQGPAAASPQRPTRTSRAQGADQRREATAQRDHALSGAQHHEAAARHRSVAPRVVAQKDGEPSGYTPQAALSTDRLKARL